MEENNQTPKGYETTDAAVKPIFIFLVGLGVLLVVVMGLMTVLFNILESHYGRSDTEVSPLVDTRQIPPGPRLQVYPAEELKEVRGWEEEQLGTYGWVEETTGIFRIPIDRAIEIVAESGLPSREGAEGSDQQRERGEETPAE